MHITFHVQSHLHVHVHVYVQTYTYEDMKADRRTNRWIDLRIGKVCESVKVEQFL